MSHNYVETNYSTPYGTIPERSAAVFATESHDPRAPRPLDPTQAAEHYATHPGVAAHPQAGVMEEAPSPMSSYRGSFSHPASMALPHHRQDSISSISSPHDVTGGGPGNGWAPSSPGIAPSRHASIYSLNGQFDSVGLGSSIDSGSTNGHFYDQSPPIPAQLRYAQNQAADARRFSLDERAIRTQPQMNKPGMISAEYQAPGSGRHWPWGAANAPGIHGRHASVSAAPPQSYDYGRAPYPANPSMQPAYGYDAAATLSPTRYRSMSSSAASGRSYPNPYGMPGTAAHTAAAMGYGLPPHLGAGMMLDGDMAGGHGHGRRAKFKRSRTGCLVCRKRKVKCSQDGTPCKQCRIGKRDCHYDDSPQKKKPHKKEKGSNSGDGTLSDKGSNGVSALSQVNGDHHGNLSSSDSYYSANDLGQRAEPNGNVTFSMPFSQGPPPTVASHASAADPTWSNPTPFASTGPHGEAHPVSHHDGYTWASKQAQIPPQPAPYGEHQPERQGYWSHHPSGYAPRTAELDSTGA